MSFLTFTEDQNLLRRAVREFVEAEVAPHAAEWDEKDVCPVELFPKMGELGICGIFVPEQYGGAGMGYTERMICLEEISRHSAGLGIALMTHHLGMAPILKYGSEEQKKKYLPDFCAGKKITGLATTEPGGGSDFTGQKTVAEKTPSGWKISGRKCFITNSHIADATVLLAKTGEDEKGRTKLSMFIVDKDVPGFSAGRKEHKLGLRGSVTGDLSLVDVQVGDGALLGAEGVGAKLGMEAISEVGRAGMSAICLGILGGCVEEGVKFAGERVLYGKPLSRLQAIQMEIAQIRIQYESARLLSYHAAGLKDQGIPCACEFAMAKYQTSEGAVAASKRLMDLMGGYGIIDEYPVGRFLRDALASIASGGTSHIQQLIIAGNTFSDFRR